MPFTVATLFHGRWMFGETFCRFQGFEALTIGTNSLGTMGIIAVSRYFCVVKPEKYPLLFKKQRYLAYIVTVWCAALAGSVPPFFFSTMADLNSSRVRQCVCTHLKVTLPTLSLSSACTSRHPY